MIWRNKIFSTLKSTKFFLAEMLPSVMHHLIIVIKVHSLEEILSIIRLPRLSHIFLNSEVQNGN